MDSGRLVPVSAYTVRPATITDAWEYVTAHLELTIVTYLHSMPREVAQHRRTDLGRRVEQFLEQVSIAEAGGEPRRRYWAGINPAGAICGVACSGPGIDSWERDYFGADFVFPDPEFELEHLYVAPGAQGSGLGQRLLDAALPAGRGAYLWVIGSNARAEAFYRRNRFVEDGCGGITGPTWGGVPFFRMTRPDA